MALQRRVEELRRLLLPHKFDPTGSYVQAERVRAKALAFRVLAHAELESYFEDRVVEIAKVALREWKARAYVSRVTLHLLGFSGRDMALPPDTLEPPTENKAKTWSEAIDIAKRLEASVADFVYRTTKHNHGIKEKNVIQMLLPVGFPRDRMDQLLLTALEQFGDDRGLVAHSSGATYVTQSVDPSDEYGRLQNLIRDLHPIDAELNGLLTSAAMPAAPAQG
nr:hypothetical protein P9270_004750 [Mesorhizobium sp. WSM4875]